MEGSKKCAEYLLTKNVERCMNEIKKRWVSYGRFTGKITILDATKEEIELYEEYKKARDIYEEIKYR